MSQSRRGSLIEACLGTFIGYSVAVLSQIVIFPFFNIHISVTSNLLIGVWFTFISLIRSYYIRRLFNYLHRKNIII